MPRPESRCTPSPAADGHSGQARSRAPGGIMSYTDAQVSAATAAMDKYRGRDVSLVAPPPRSPSRAACLPGRPGINHATQKLSYLRHTRLRRRSKMEERAVRRWAAFAGLAFVALLVISIVLTIPAPMPDKS